MKDTLPAPPVTRVKPGDKLPNGATVIAVRPCPKYDNSESKAVVVLAMWRGDEYATWVAAEDGTGTSWGHYFDADRSDGFTDAADDFRTR